MHLEQPEKLERPELPVACSQITVTNAKLNGIAYYRRLV